MPNLGRLGPYIKYLAGLKRLVQENRSSLFFSRVFDEEKISFFVRLTLGPWPNKSRNLFSFSVSSIEMSKILLFGLCLGGTVVVHSSCNPKIQGLNPEAVFLVLCDPSMNEL